MRVLCDAGDPRNATSRGLHGFLSRDRVTPEQLLRLGREELRRYGVEYCQAAVREAHRQKDGFVVRIEKDQALRRRKLLLATGMEDKLPDIENIQRFYGRSVFHCPYCDGW